MGHQLAGGNSSWRPELESQTTHFAMWPWSSGCRTELRWTDPSGPKFQQSSRYSLERPRSDCTVCAPVMAKMCPTTVPSRSSDVPPCLPLRRVTLRAGRGSSSQIAADDSCLCWCSSHLLCRRSLHDSARSGVEQLVEHSQTRYICAVLSEASRSLIDGRRTLAESLDALEAAIDQQVFKHLRPRPCLLCCAI